MSIENQIVQIASYQLTETADAFTKTIRALSRRTHEDGPEGILRYSFYVNPENGTAGSTILYRDPEAWLSQHDFAISLDEYQDFYQTIRLVGLKFFGNLSPKIHLWLEERDLAYEYAGPLAAGFER